MTTLAAFLLQSVIVWAVWAGLVLAFIAAWRGYRRLVLRRRARITVAQIEAALEQAARKRKDPR